MISEATLRAFSATIFYSSHDEHWLPKTLPACVISGQNPLCILQPRQQNVMLHYSLCNYLDRLFPSCDKEEIVGRASDGFWQEDCWVVYGLTTEQALPIASLFGQLAFFYLDENGRQVILCNHHENEEAAIAAAQNGYGWK